MGIVDFKYYRKPSWWKQRTTLEKLLIIVSVVATVAIAALAITLVSVILKEKLQPDARMILAYLLSIICKSLIF